jgi:flagellar hook assembly protein FlgD
LSTRELSLNDLTVSPNPAADFTKVAFSTRKAGDVSVRVMNLLGQEVKTLAAGSLEAGNHSFVWNLDANNGGAVEMGTYLVEIVANGVKSAEKVFVTK